jgi:hypothetical protein
LSYNRSIDENFSNDVADSNIDELSRIQGGTLHIGRLCLTSSDSILSDWNVSNSRSNIDGGICTIVGIKRIRRRGLFIIDNFFLYFERCSQELIRSGSWTDDFIWGIYQSFVELCDRHILTLSFESTELVEDSDEITDSFDWRIHLSIDL